MDELIIYFVIILIFLIGIRILSQQSTNNALSGTGTLTLPSTGTTTTTKSSSTSPSSSTTSSKSPSSSSTTSNSPSSSSTTSSTSPLFTLPPMVGSVINGLETTVTDPKLYEAIAIQIALQIAIKESIIEAVKYSSKLATKAVEEVGVKVGEDALEKLGVVASKEVAEVVAKDLGEDVAKEGVRLGAQTTVSTSVGPVGPIVEAAFFAFDVLSFGLDIGDAGGYNKMGTKQSYITMRDGINADINTAFAQANVSTPIVVGPLDNLIASNPTGYNQQLQSEITNLVNGSYGKPMQTAIVNDLTSGKIKSTDLNNPTILANYTKLLDMDTITNVASGNLCTSLGGKLVNLPNDKTNYCSYADKFSCENSYTWPLGPIRYLL